MQIAQVIVDVPTRQTNSSYSYLIPNELSDQIKLGMRVVVPFGKRHITGFVVGIDNSTEFNGKLKEIISLIDLIPQLNSELLKLSDWLASETYSFKINCLQTMLPGSLHVKTKKVIKALSGEVVEKYPKIFNGNNEIEYNSDQLSTEDISIILDLQKQNKISVNYELLQNAKPMMVNVIKNKLSNEELKSKVNEIRKNAVSQLKLLDLLQSNPNQELMVSKVIKMGITMDAINNFVKKGWLDKYLVQKQRNPFASKAKKTTPFSLNKSQQNAVDHIVKSIENKSDTTFLLEGVTGSGKTEVYLQSIDFALKSGKTALLLVPEITLTPQIVERIRGRFGNEVALQHSSLSDGERFDEWQRINSGQAKVVVGVRSAIFAPLENVGLIIIDEEHDSSYKQGENPRYQTREVAKWRGKYNHCPVVLGSATPSLETRARAHKGLYKLLSLPTRINNQALPEVSIVDMKEEITTHSGGISSALQVAIRKRIDRHEQVILMLNRRGYSNFIMCRDCGFVPQCPNCDITLTMHKDTHTLNCHYCGHRESIPNKCSNCGSKRMRTFGMGSQKLEEEVKNLYPDARVLRMDVDTTRKKGMHEKIINQFGNHEADILVGTQMIAKGLDFPNVTLVGVLNADSALAFPDFRSSERTFELLTQVAGRSGRADKKGEVIIQTYNPDHYAIQLSKIQDYELFYKTEMRVRHLGNYPPYYYTIKLTASSKIETQTMQTMFSVFNFLKKRLSSKAIILGPTPKLITRVNNRYYYQIIIKYQNEPNLKDTLNKLLNGSQKKGKNDIQFSIDNDPIDFM